MAALDDASNIVRFPPLPAIPAPPRSEPDPRQSAFTRIASSLVDAMSGEMYMATANVQSGFPAAAVDLGCLKSALELGIANLSMSQVKERWDDDVFLWLRRTIRAWVQRCKQLTMEPKELCIRVELETQDDLGYYTYVFESSQGRRIALRQKVAEGFLAAPRSG